MDDLIAFLNARLDEDEAAALPFGHTVWRDEGPPIGVILVDGEALIEGHITGLTTHIARHDPARVLHDVAADRRILARYAALRSPVTLKDRMMFPSLAEVVLACIRDRAERFSYHPDYPQAQPSDA